MYEDNDRLIRQYQEGRKELLGTIIKNNQGLIHTTLKSFKWAYNEDKKHESIIGYNDLFQEGVIGLCSAIEKHDPEQGAFSTYAMIWIKQSVFRFYYNHSRVIRVPQEPRKAYLSLKRSQEEYIKRYEKEPSTKELSVYSGVSVDDILELRRTFSNPISIDAPVGNVEDESITVGDSIPDNTDYLEGIERDLTIKALRKDLERMATDVLKDDKKVKQLFFYFDNLDKMQISEISEACGVPRSSLNRMINESSMKISRKYLDELIEGYIDLFSSGIRRAREMELMRRSMRESIKLVASKQLDIGDSITVIDSFSENGLKESVQATVRMVDEFGVNVSFVGIDYHTKEYTEKRKIIPFQNIIDFRTENKKIVEIGCLRGLL